MTRFLVVALMLLAGAISNSFAQVRVAVTPFEVGDYALEPYADAARGVLEDIVIGFGNVQIVERQRMDTMVEEMTLGQSSGLADPAEAAQFGRISGANILLTGSLLKADTEIREFQGYGVSTRTAITTATIRVRAYDAERGTVLFSTTSSGENRNFNTSSGGQGQVDARSAAIEKAVARLADDQRFREIFAGIGGNGSSAAATVAVEFAPVPDNCDLEINGIYQGSTPTTIELADGATLTVRLTKARHDPWERQIVVRSGLRVTPELEPALD